MPGINYSTYFLKFVFLNEVTNRGMNNKKLQVWFPLLFAMAMIIGMYFGYKLRDYMPLSKNVFRSGNRGQLQEVIELIRARYVDAVNLDTLNDNAIQEMLSHLDPHSVFIPAKQLQDVNEDLAGRFEGIGVEFNIFLDTVHVLNVLRDGPSDKAGLRVGDRIIMVDDSIVAGNQITSDKIRKMLRGPRGSEVSVTVLRGNTSKEFVIRRGFIPLFSLDAAYVVAPQTGYIKLNKFSETTYEEFMEALEKLQKQGIKKLILDLRGNGGGILDEAVEMADEFLEDNKLITYTEGNKSARKEYRCKRPGIFEKGDLVLLLDEGSASASEVLAGALQDWDRAIIAGRRSFGKGLVQEQYNLSDGSALRLTVARYYTPLGRSIQKPYDAGIDDYNDEILNRYQHGEFIHADSIRSANGKAFVTKNGKSVYGGGGITPDTFIAFDTSRLDTSLTGLYRRNTIGDFVYRYYVANRGIFDLYTSPGNFQKNFYVDDKIIQAFTAFAARDSVFLTVNKTSEKDLLRLRLKSLFARQIWRSEGFYEVVNAEDKIIKKAIELISN
jgi:carboxyl-terminal processing protease